MIDIDVRCKGAALVIRTMNETPKNIQKAISMSVNKIALSARTQMAREAAREYFIGVGKARKTISITKKAAINSLKAQITSVEIPILWRILKYRPRKYSIKAVKKKRSACR